MVTGGVRGSGLRCVMRGVYCAVCDEVCGVWGDAGEREVGIEMCGCAMM